MTGFQGWLLSSKQNFDPVANIVGNVTEDKVKSSDSERFTNSG